MSLCAAGLGDHAVVERGIGFLERSAREDGSWPIDTNLSTWLTTLSVNALWVGSEGFQRVDVDVVVEWLLAQQYRREHPYTGAAPGGWAWTDLPGGVPDADDTAGAVLALSRLRKEEERVRRAALSGIEWLLDLQNSDGGIPTFCKGWGYLPFDRSGADLTAHCLRAFRAWRDVAPPRLCERMDRAMRKAIRFLRENQRPDGSWIPLWFGNQYEENEENPVYGTSRVLIALAEIFDSRREETLPLIERAAAWLFDNRNPDGGWGGAKGTPSTIEETALSLEALSALSENGFSSDSLASSLKIGSAWLAAETERGVRTPPSPIGFYFAKLWYFEKLYPLIFSTAALGRLASRRA